ncbi:MULTISPECIES: HNH endonuclease [Acinetobacter]|uniref:HNH endonuclease n=1 Tax=Acinetobacter TaxID=469 RepID=UPI00257A9546|nr:MULTISPECIES: HNH endonuclease [Acinetobacter]
MLAKTQIQQCLEKLGFRLTPPANPYNYKVLEFTHTRLKYPVYVKNTNRFPLVIHDTFLSERPNLLNISGVFADPNKPEYFCSNMYAFNKKLNPYTKMTPKKAPERFGLDFGFESEIAIKKFLDSISLKNGTSVYDKNDPKKLDPEDVDDSFDETISLTEKDIVIKARIGQGAYRKALLDYWGGCAVSGCKIESMLISSHIKPWSVDREARLDPFNGLLLSPTLDRAFDQRLISFNDDGSIILSSTLTATDLELLHLNPALRLRKLDERHLPYLSWHRAHLVK